LRKALTAGSVTRYTLLSWLRSADPSADLFYPPLGSVLSITSPQTSFAHVDML